jgi:hypothetical protein
VTIDAEAVVARTTARLLASGRVSAVSSAALSLFALIVLAFGSLTPHAWLWWCVAALGLPAAWLALRVTFDAHLFNDLAGAEPAAPAVERLVALDHALQALGVVRAGGPEPRLLVDRARGARGLLMRQAGIAALQLVLALAATWPGL